MITSNYLISNFNRTQKSLNSREISQREAQSTFNSLLREILAINNYKTQLLQEGFKIESPLISELMIRITNHVPILIVRYYDNSQQKMVIADILSSLKELELL